MIGIILKAALSSEGGAGWVRKVTNPNAKFLFTFLFIVWAVVLRDRAAARSAQRRQHAVRRAGADRPLQRLLHHDGPALGGDRGVDSAQATRRPAQEEESRAPTTHRHRRQPCPPRLVLRAGRIGRRGRGACDPFLTTAGVRRLRADRAATVLGFDLGAATGHGRGERRVPRRPSTRASDRVVSAQAATSVDGTPIRYAIVGDPDRVTPDGLATIRANLQTLRDPLAEGAAARRRPGRHAGDPVGLGQRPRQRGERHRCRPARALRAGRPRRLRRRRHPGRRPRRDPADAEPRRPRGGHAPQPVRLRHEPRLVRPDPARDGRQARGHPAVPADAVHRRARVRAGGLLLPAERRPRVPRDPGQAHDWINELYSPAIAGEFDRQGIKYFHGAPYDFFAIVFGDTVPTAGYHAAGMTFEKESGDPIADREHEHFTSIWASVAAGAAARDAVVAGWRASYVEAYAAGPRRHSSSRTPSSSRGTSSSSRSRT